MNGNHLILISTYLRTMYLSALRWLIGGCVPPLVGAGGFAGDRTGAGLILEKKVIVPRCGTVG